MLTSTLAFLPRQPVPVASLRTAGLARAGGTIGRLARRALGLLLLTVLLALLTPAWAQVPAFTTSRSTGNTYTSIGTTGTSFTFSGTSTDDNTSAAVTLPAGFAFTYQGTAITGFVACTNGWLSLDPTVTDNSWVNNLGGNANSAPIPQVLAPLWDDLVCQGNNGTAATLAASMKYLVTGTAPNRVLTVEWLGMEIYQNAGPNLNFQIKLFETTNVIQYQYGIMSGFSGARDYTYSYSLGLNGTAPATTYLAQQVSNSNYFAQANGTTANTGANVLTVVPESYSQVQFVPAATLTTGTAPGTTVPANNEPAGAIALPIIYYSPTTFATAYTSANATASAGITACSATTPGTPDDDVWFTFNLASTQNTSVTLRGSGGYDPVLQVFSNAGTTALACVNATGTGLTENYNNPALPAGTYYVRVYHAGTGSGTTGQFALAAYVTPPVPANNECAGAVALTSAGTCVPVSGTSLGGTASASVPACVGTPDDDVWYKFTTGATARTYTLTVAGGADYDAVVQVLSGSCGTYTSVSCTNATPDGGTETVTLSSLMPNTTYYVRVYEFDPGYSSGDFTICLTDNLPRIASFTPASGPVGTSVAITGTGLTGATAVSLNGTAGTIAGTPTVTGLTFTVAAGSTSGAITLATPVGVATSAANPVLRLQATGGTSSDNTAYLDQVEVLDASSGAVVAGGISNGSFETGAPAGALTSPGGAVTPWTFGGSARLSTTASAFGPPAAPDGTAHVVVLQLGGCYVEQALTLAAGTYQVRFQLAQRQCCATPYDQGINVLLNGVRVGTSLNTSSAGYVSLVSAPFSVSTAGAFTVIQPPTLTAVAPNPGGLGQSITLTGTNLSNPTALTINGANALGNIVSNSGTGLVVRVPVTAAATGNVSLTTVAGSASIAFAVMTPPGNALAIDNGANYVEMNTQAGISNLAASGYTIEAWVYLNTVSGVQSVIRKDGDYNFYFTNGLPRTQIWSPATTLRETTGTTAVVAGRWYHVAGTWDGTSLRVYLNGVDVTGGTNVTSFTAYNLPLRLGRSAIFNEPLNGRLDEVRIYNTPLTPSQIQSDMRSTGSALPANLQAYYNFDQGTAGGNNAGLSTLYDVTGAGNTGTLTGFALTGTTSNYVESYALVVPTATAATALAVNGFTANWTAPAAGTVDNGYRLDVSTTADFASPITGSPFTVASGTSQAVTGLTAGTTYYYRVRADKTTVTGQGAYSNTVTVTVPCPAPVATAQNVNLLLDITGIATVTAAQVNNGSTANCGPAPASALSLQRFATGVISGEVAEGGTLTLTAPNGGTFTAINFASYGTPTGTSGSYATSSCNASTSPSVVGAALLGNNSGSIVANNATFGDPCVGTVKKLAVTATYEYYSAAAPAATSLAYTCADVGPHYVMLTVTSATGATSQAPAKVTVGVPPTPTTTWSGAASTDWTDCANWSYGQVPTAAISAVVPTGLSRYPSLPTGTFAVLNLTVNSGGSLTVASGATLQVNGNFANNGTATMSGKLQFVGSATSQTLGGSTSTPFTTLVVNKASGTVQLGQNLTINSALTLTSGTLTTTASYQVNLGGSANLSEVEGSYVIGKVAINRTLAAGTAESFSGLGLTLTPTAGSTAPGATLVTRTTGTAIAGAGTSQSILRAFNIQPAVNTGLNVTMNFGYFTHELNGIPVANLRLFKSVSGGTPWIPQRGTTASTNVVTKTGITDFSVWTLGNAANPLPVELSNFTAQAVGPSAVQLAWTTASEKNSARFEAERSTDGTSFAAIGQVAGQGTKTAPTTYDLLDTHLPAGSATLYYRLRQVDLDGTVSYSPVRTVTLSGQPTSSLTLVPNPAQTTTLAGAQAGAPVEVYDAVGRRVLTASADAAGTTLLVLPVGLATGIYVVRSGTQAVRLVVE